MNNQELKSLDSFKELKDAFRKVFEEAENKGFITAEQLELLSCEPGCWQCGTPERPNTCCGVRCTW